jgi:hypothetical protein
MIGAGITMGFIWEYAIEAHRVTVRVENETSPTAAITVDGVPFGEATEGSTFRAKFERREAEQLSITTGEHTVVFDDEDGLDVDAIDITIAVESDENGD